MEINWFPGHMAKALRKIQTNLKMVDLVIETSDARIPKSSRNPVLDEIIGQKPRLLLLNKSDLAQIEVTKEWVEALSSETMMVLALNGTKVNEVNSIRQACLEMCKDKVQRALDKGRIARPVRAMVVGIPNTGKSTIINTLAKKKVAVTSDRPGVTKSPQWIRAGDDLELMDMPGVLWPKIEQKKSQILLAGTGAIRDTVVDGVEVAFEMMKILAEQYPKKIESRYKISLDREVDYDLFLEAARKRGCILSGNRIDEERFAGLFLDEIRAGVMGPMTFETP